jgi:hypothetical protein
VLAFVVEAHRFLFAFGDASVGLYLYVAERLLHGELPYLTAWEYKPPGLFAYYAVALAATGRRPALAVGTLTALSTFATALGLWRLGPLVDRTAAARSGRYAALFYVLLAPENEGYLGDAEVLLAPFATAAFVMACGDVTLRTAFFAGLLASCALQMKLSVLPVIAVPALVMASRSRRPFATVASYALAALSPFAFEAVLYARAGALPALVDANAGATFRRFAGLHGGIVRENLVWFVRQLRELAPALELAPFALPASVNARRSLSWGWLAAALISIAAVGEFYDRQFVLTVAPVALLGGLGLRAVTERVRVPRSAVLALVFVATFALHDYWETAQTLGIAYGRGVLHEPAYREGSYASLLRALRRLPRGSLFVIQESPLLYVDYGVASPTRFPYTDHLLDPRMTQMTGVPGTRELARIFARAPRIVIAGDISPARFDPAAVAFVQRCLARDYRSVGKSDGATLYERATPPSVPESRPK